MRPLEFNGKKHISKLSFSILNDCLYEISVEPNIASLVGMDKEGCDTLSLELGEDERIFAVKVETRYNNVANLQFLLCKVPKKEEMDQLLFTRM